MNKERLTELADYIENLPHYTKQELPIQKIQYYLTSEAYDLNYFNQITGFNMDHWFSDRECGTAGCIAGHTIAKYGTDEEKKFALNSPFTPGLVACRLLELGIDESSCLFHHVCFIQILIYMC